MERLVILADTLLENRDESLEQLTSILTHDLFTVCVNSFFIILVKVEKSLAKSKNGTSSLSLHLKCRLVNHELTENRHELSMEFDLSIRAKLFH